MCHPSVMMRRQAVLDVGKYQLESQTGEDLGLFLQLADAGGRLANLPDVLHKYRAHHSSVSYAQFEFQRQIGIRLVLEARHRRGLPDDPEAIPAQCPKPTPLLTQIKWGWWALNSGHVSTARKHARACLRQSPFSWACWRLFLCALRGY